MVQRMSLSAYTIFDSVCNKTMHVTRVSLRVWFNDNLIGVHLREFPSQFIEELIVGYTQTREIDNSC